MLGEYVVMLILPSSRRRCTGSTTAFAIQKWLHPNGGASSGLAESAELPDLYVIKHFFPLILRKTLILLYLFFFASLIA